MLEKLAVWRAKQGTRKLANFVDPYKFFTGTGKCDQAKSATESAERRWQDWMQTSSSLDHEVA